MGNSLNKRSAVMTNRAERFPPLQWKKDHNGWIWGYVNVFDLRSGRSIKNPLADRRQSRKEVDKAICHDENSNSCMKFEAPNPCEKSFNVKDVDKSVAATLEFKTSVKELIEEDMLADEQNLKKQRNDIELDPGACSLRKGRSVTKWNSKRTYETYDRSRRSMSLPDLDDLNSDTKLPDQVDVVLEAKLGAAIDMCVSHKLKNARCLGEDEVIDNSKEFIDALKTLSCNKELCWRLLRDPKSRLVKHIESLEDEGEEGRTTTTRHIKSNVMQKDDKVKTRKCHFFRRRSKSQESYHHPSMEYERSHHSTKIVILKPSTAGLHPSHTLVNKLEQNVKNLSHFSFTEIKKRLKKAMGKEWQEIPRDLTIRKKHNNTNKVGISGENNGWSSPNRNHFYIERFANPPFNFTRGDTKGKAKDIENEESKYIKLDISNTPLQGKHKKEEELICEDLPREVQSFAAGINSEQVNARVEVPCDLTCDNLLEIDISSCNYEVAKSDREESAPTGYQEDEKVLGASCERNSFPVTIDSGHDVTQMVDEETSFKISEVASRYLSDSCGEKENLCCWSAPPDVNPSSTVYHSVELPIQPPSVHFKEPAASLDQQLDMFTFSENEESAFEYVEAVLLGSGLNWDEYILSWLSSDQILDPSLFDEIELLTDRSCKKLLFDCVNDVLSEICGRYIAQFTGMSFVKHSLRSAPKGMDLIQEVWKGVEWWYHLNNTPPPTHSLDPLVEKDMARPAAWMDLKYDLLNIVFRIEEAVLEELVEETLLIFVNDIL
ncbi:unnamed protein product [Cuscuta epithymum]|uniref:DUF4378 domain-containing protein n=1 Tax=Cuscuta epithymum TaxID=186058 RepID=A0AAV0EXS6_9ASTE|nr:unnamed protein product [Cuscuta epithymum]